MTNRQGLFYQSFVSKSKWSPFNRKVAQELLETLARPGSPMTVPFEASLTLLYLKAYDARNGSHFSERLSDFYVRLATVAASVDGPPSAKAIRELENIKAQLQPTPPQIRPEARLLLHTAGQVSEVSVSKAFIQTLNAVTARITSGQTAEPTLAMLMSDLNSLIGLERVKQDVTELTNYITVQQMRRTRGLKTPQVSLHMVFYGNPGTGKTTVARLLSQIYKALGVVSKGQLVETDRSGLIAGYVGQTALKVKAVVERAFGGILFIDEAYALKRPSDSQDFGDEAIETLEGLPHITEQELLVSDFIATSARAKA